ncbi:hypothetical protein WSK_3323 [Novosphingobium sp. Rr 2-17]|uniref:hypothetical protein n=1 Tax=Novosphingobium sp. Rr 2-17 TaxID=555793 RepID=UPI0002698F23|nr:hypothetical protein [Novosphingobium sp. Rr 2-17]EIZ78110.1 hypothetical protein WSK_3323 [Novosphingobium sp. Rr 2-17]
MTLRNSQLLAGALAIGAIPAIAGAQTSIDVSGVWAVEGDLRQLKTQEGATPPLKPVAAKAYAKTKAKLAAGNLSFDPTARCVSPGLPRILTLPYPFQIMQRPDKILYLFQWNYWNRRVDLTGRKQEAPYPLALGVSSGRIEGGQMIVETRGLRADNTFLDAAGMPHSDKISVEERMTLADGGQTLVDRVTIVDPQTFTRPWTTVLRFKRLPDDTRIEEDICLDRLKAGKPAVDWSRAIPSTAQARTK